MASCIRNPGNFSYDIITSQVESLKNYGSQAYNQAMAAMRDMQRVFGDQFSPSYSGISMGGSGNDTGIVEPDHSIAFIPPNPAPTFAPEFEDLDFPKENKLDNLDDLDAILKECIKQLSALTEMYPDFIPDMEELFGIEIEFLFIEKFDDFYSKTSIEINDILNSNELVTKLMNGFLSTLETWLNSEDSIGMPEEVRTLLLERAFATEDQQAARAKDEAMNGWLARGFTLPSGPMEAGIWLVEQQSRDKKGALNRDIFIESAKWERETRQLAMEMTTKYRQELQDQYFKRKELAKSLATQWQDYEIKIKLLRFDIYKIRLSIWESLIEALGKVTGQISSTIKVYMERFNVLLELFKTKLQTQLQYLERDLKVFNTQVELYKTAGQFENWRIDPMLKLEQMDLDTSKLKVDLRMKDRELELQKLLRTAEITINALHGIATVGAQLSGAAMGAVNVGATMSSGYSEGNSSDCTTTYSYSY